jgi:lysophospholipase L1-like esterase
MNLQSKTIPGLLILAGLSGIVAQPAAAQKTYIAVGDSLAYGFKSLNPASPNFTDAPTLGQPGYVTAYANTLAAQSGSVYSVLNLGVIGETTSTLFTTATSSYPNDELNSNYGTADTQAALLNTQLTQLGSSVGAITIQLGANDELEAFEAGGATAATAALATVQSNFNILLSQIKSDEGGGPLTNVTIIGYYDPYENLPTSSPYYFLKTASPSLTTSLNSVLAQEAAAFGARYVDLYTPFSAQYGNYDSYVLANSSLDALPPPTGYTAPFPNDHPTDLGYALIAQTLAAPEPSPAWLFGLGVGGVAALTLRARRRRG